jgi:uncharacterized protein YfaP (DUF2135 family)
VQLPDANVYGTYSPTGLTTICIDAGWKGAKQLVVNGPCVPEEITPDGSFSCGPTIGLLGFRTIEIGGAGTCGGYVQIILEYQNAAGEWSQIASIGGGGVQWQSFTGSIELSSTEPDAIPAYLGNFGPTGGGPA